MANPIDFAGFPAILPDWSLPTLFFIVALALTLGSAARYTHHLERLSDFEHLSPELLGFLSALGANIPNYAASLAAFFSGHGLVGFGIIVGSNIYNIAVILGVAAFASPGGHGILLNRHEAREMRALSWLVAGMGFGVLALAATPFSPQSLAGSQALHAVLAGLILVLFALVVRDALKPSSTSESNRGSLSDGVDAGDAALPPVADIAHRRAQLDPAAVDDVEGPAVTAASLESEPMGARDVPWPTILRAMLALCLSLIGVVVMVRSAEAAALDIRLSPVILSLVVLAVATSLPNTVVAYQLARTGRAATCVEEILSSNAINVALGAALPLLLIPVGLPGDLLTRIDVPLLAVLGLVLVTSIRLRHVPRPAALVLFGIYAVWLGVHIVG